MSGRRRLLLVTLLLLSLAAPARGAESDAELAKKTLNPVASLVSVPFQANWDFGIGPADATKFTLNVQPVVPVSLGTEWNLIVRTILPVIDMQSPVPGGKHLTGIGDTLQSFFLSPVAPVGGWIIGAGPVFLWPTGASDLGSEKTGAGPTAVVLRQEKGFTYGLLGNHVWSFAGPSGRADVNATFLQPFAGYTTKTFTTLMVNTESTYDWVASQWVVPLNVSATQMLRVAGQPVTLSAGYRYYAETPAGGPDWGLRAAFTLLLPK